jgi:hypothetical protein
MGMHQLQVREENWNTIQQNIAGNCTEPGMPRFWRRRSLNLAPILTAPARGRSKAQATVFAGFPSPAEGRMHALPSFNVDSMEIASILHHSRDLSRHLPPEYQS